MVNHLLVQSFSTLKADRTLPKRLLGADEALLTSFAHAELPTRFMTMSKDLLLMAPSCVSHGVVHESNFQRDVHATRKACWPSPRHHSK